MIRTAVRRSAAVIALTAALVASGDVAFADTPIPGGGWQSKPNVNDLHAWLTFVGIPVLVLLVISALVLAPALARGEKLFYSGDAEPEGQWLGGPRKAVGELAEPDTEDSAAGGAGGTW
ncbi:MAG TPA: hypothetical protein VJ872_01265 [Nocardioides sp.]|nr:hypothetical protein [Nocardioides sp.]